MKFLWSSGGGVARASVGKYVRDRIFIGYRQGFTNDQFQNASEGRIEYAMSRAVEGQATVGDKTKDVPILYTKDFWELLAAPAAILEPS